MSNASLKLIMHLWYYCITKTQKTTAKQLKIQNKTIGNNKTILNLVIIQFGYQQYSFWLVNFIKLFRLFDKINEIVGNIKIIFVTKN